MTRINLLRRKNPLERTENLLREGWRDIDPAEYDLPEVILQGDAVLHTDELGYIVDDCTGDQAYSCEKLKMLTRHIPYKTEPE